MTKTPVSNEYRAVPAVSLIGLSILSLLLTTPLSAAVPTDSTNGFAPNVMPSLQISRLQGTITIDGDLTDTGWKGAAVADNFAENEPGDQIRPAVQSKALITYDDNHLYVAFVAYDDPGQIRVSMRERDNIFRDDFIGLMLDTYGDQGWGYEIFVNPFGLQGDVRMLASGEEDESFDLVFESKGKVTDSGYQVELAIPFSSLRFPNRPEQTWRANFWRDRPREVHYQYTWAALDRDNPCFICQWGSLTGVKGIKPSSNIEILPTIVGYKSGRLVNDDYPDSGFVDADPDAEVSLNVRYGISSNSSAEITLNPDFSQVESDAEQIDVNTTFGLYFPEHRPFFQEGSNLFDTRIDAIHTRTINNPEAAAKFTGQFGRVSLAYLTAYDKNSTILLPFIERSFESQADRSVVNIFRIKNTLWEDSHIGALITDRRLHDFTVDGRPMTGGYGTTYGIDGVLRLRKNYRFAFQTLGSQTREPNAPGLIEVDSSDRFDRGRYTMALDGESFVGHAVYSSLERSSRYWSVTGEYTEYSPAFRTDNGFTMRNGYREMNFYGGLDFRPNRPWLIQWHPFLIIGRLWEHSGRIDLDPFAFTGGTKDEWIRGELYFQTRGPMEIELAYLNSCERFAGKLFEGINRVEIDVVTRFSEMLAIGGELQLGRIIYRNPDSPEMGRSRDLVLEASFKPTQRLFIQPHYAYAHMEHLDSYLARNPKADRVIYSGYILRTRLTYQFTREWYLRLVVQYDDFDERLDVEPLLTYQLNPFTVFYVGANSSHRHYDQADDPSMGNPEWKLSSRQYFAKLQYLFRV